MRGAMGWMPLVLLGWLFLVQGALAATLAGTVELAEGEARLTPADGRARPIKAGDAVAEGDTIATGRDGEVHVRLEDHGFIAVRPNTALKIETYRHQGDEEDKSLFSLMKGTFRSVTGWIGRYNARNYAIRTPTATIGVRGTDHEPMFVPEGEESLYDHPEPGTYDKVNEGESYIENPHGKVAIAPNRAGFVPLREKVAPRLLERIPAIFRPSRFEALIEKRKEILKQKIEERAKEIKQRLLERRDDFKQQLRERQDERRQQLMDQREQRRDGLQQEKGRREELRRSRVEQRERLSQEKRRERVERQRPQAGERRPLRRDGERVRQRQQNQN